MQKYIEIYQPGDRIIVYWRERWRLGEVVRRESDWIFVSLPLNGDLFWYVARQAFPYPPDLSENEVESYVKVLNRLE